MYNILTIFLLAISLSMDTFSLSMCYGTLNIPNKKAYLLSSIVGIFHFIMPLIGLKIGNLILKNLIIDSKYVLLLIFCIIGIDMIISSFKKNEKNILLSIGGIFLFALSVSLDSFSTGLGLNLITNHVLLSLCIFTLISSLFTFLGIKLGKYLSNKYGNIASIIGGIILIILGVYFFLH